MEIEGLRCLFSAFFGIVGSSHIICKCPNFQTLATDSIKGEHLYVIPAQGELQQKHYSFEQEMAYKRLGFDFLISLHHSDGDGTHHRAC